MNENSPRLLYFEIINANGTRLYTLHQDEKAIIKVAVYIPDNIISSKVEDGDFFIQWTINGKNIQYNDIPIQEIIKTGRRIVEIEFELDVYLQDSINLNLSLGAKYSYISPQEQIEQFSFFKTIIERKKTILVTDSMGKRPVPPTDKAINDFKDQSNFQDKDKHDKGN